MMLGKGEPNEVIGCDCKQFIQNVLGQWVGLFLGTTLLPMDPFQCENELRRSGRIRIVVELQ